MRMNRTDYNIWIAPDDVLKCQLSKYDMAIEDNAIRKRDTGGLFALQGQTIMQLVMQVASRQALERITTRGGWRVDPRIPEEIRKCLNEYNTVRAPLYPLPASQRLGFLDEAETILCKKDL
jgi:hypothetical protein